ncbi:MAG: ABC transporter permease [Nitrososphaerota archaeon]|nr:ABC transporter permease [Nitrososphaerota archaeon]
MSDSSVVRWQNFAQSFRRLTYDRMALAGLVMLAAIVALALLAPYITPYPNEAGAYANFGQAFLSPSLSHLFGTDDVGRDVFTRVIFGFRISLFIAVVVLIPSVILGVTLGLVAGYYGGWVEALVERVTDVFLALPALIFALVIAGILGPSLQDVIIALLSLWWNWYARIMFTLTKSLKNQPYVEAARVQGAGAFRIMFREILPNAASTLSAKMMLDAGFIILIEAGMGFLGIGVRPPTPDLGVMVANGSAYIATKWWIPVFPSIALTLLILAFNLIGNGIRDLFDVKVI